MVSGMQKGIVGDIAATPCPRPRCERGVIQAKGEQDQHGAAGCWRRLSDRQQWDGVTPLTG